MIADGSTALATVPVKNGRHVPPWNLKPVYKISIVFYLQNNFVHTEITAVCGRPTLTPRQESQSSPPAAPNTHTVPRKGNPLQLTNESICIS